MLFYFLSSRIHPQGSECSYDSKKAQITMTETGDFCSLPIAYRWDDSFDFHCFGVWIDEKRLVGVHNRACGHENRAPAHVDVCA